MTEVSPYPVTTAGVATIVGNASVAASLTAGNHQIEVFARLLKDEDTRSGYQWDLSEGPDLEITPGTVGSALVDLRERPPITFVIPILRGWDGFGRRLYILLVLLQACASNKYVENMNAS